MVEVKVRGKKIICEICEICVTKIELKKIRVNPCQSVVKRIICEICEICVTKIKLKKIRVNPCDPWSK